MGRIAQTTIAASAGTDNTVVFSQLLTVALFPRLSRIASAYQRYRFTSLEFLIQPMCPSLTGGGYVAGFLKDPTDTDTSFDSIQGSHGAVVAKWWEHKTLKVIPPKDLLWTSQGENVRLSSPGKFALTNVGTNTDIVNVSVMCKWTAELSVPSLEKETSLSEFITNAALVESNLTNGSNKFNVLEIFASIPKLNNLTVLTSEYPFYVDYKLGTGDVTKASYMHLQYQKATEEFVWGYFNSQGTANTFVPGVNYFSDSQPQQIILGNGARLNIVYDPNA